ncbi:phage tail assembly protein [Thermomonas sp.]|uniref:phage tail assembly protein n=1 Tax=Thermomonas sp. TaxID=1971895 RepID=UPI0035B30393
MKQPTTPAGITLETPITRGEQSIAAVALRKPAAGELRGIALADLLRLDVAALIAVLPRITTPTLTAQDVQQLDLVDITALGTELLGFFMSKADRANLPASQTT